MTTFDAGGTGRSELWRVAARMAGDHPIRGVGANGFEHESKNYVLRPGCLTFVAKIADRPVVAHDVYLQQLAETGAIELLALLVVCAACLSASHAAASRFRAVGVPAMAALASATTVAIVGLLTASVFISNGTDERLWVVLDEFRDPSDAGRQHRRRCRPRLDDARRQRVVAGWMQQHVGSVENRPSRRGDSRPTMHFRSADIRRIDRTVHSDHWVGSGAEGIDPDVDPVGAAGRDFRGFHSPRRSYRCPIRRLFVVRRLGAATSLHPVRRRPSRGGTQRPVAG